MAAERRRRARTRASPRRVAAVLAASAAVLGGGLLFAMLVGDTAVDVGRLLRFDPDPLDSRKVFRHRLPRGIAASIVGTTLAAAGLVFQALIRNPLASPYILGVSAGGSLGAVIALSLGMAFVPPFAFLGAVGAIVLVYAIARTGGRVPAQTLLLSGVIVNASLSAGIMLVNVIAEPRNQDRILRWLVGGLRDHYSGTTLALGAAAAAAGLAIAFRYARELNLVALGDVDAERAGIAIGPMRTRLFLLGSLLTAVAVSLAGPIGFVGLIVPHLLRLTLGPDHRLLVPASLGAGAAFLAVVDTLARSVWRSPLPAGVVTALLGGPVFLVLLRRGDRRRAGLDG